MIVLAIDPSGNFDEGKGTTGWSLLDENRNIIDYGQIKAIDFENAYDYNLEHIKLIKSVNPDYVVIEDFKLYADKALNQINSRFETSKLIGIITYKCEELNIKYFLQGASEVKNRWCDRILVLNNIVQKKNNKYYIDNKLVSEHTRDSIRHGIHFVTFKLKKVRNKNE